MRLPTVTLRENALLYVVKLITGSMVVWYGLRLVGVTEPYWAMISLIVVTEPDSRRRPVSGVRNLVGSVNQWSSSIATSST